MERYRLRDSDEAFYRWLLTESHSEVVERTWRWIAEFALDPHAQRKHRMEHPDLEPAAAWLITVPCDGVVIASVDHEHHEIVIHEIDTHLSDGPTASRSMSPDA